MSVLIDPIARASGRAGEIPQQKTLRLTVAAIALFAVWLATYANSLEGGFHFDDNAVIVSNASIRSLRNIPKFFLDARTFSTFATNATYRPLESVTLAVDYAIGGGVKSVPFHVTQLILTLLVGILFFFVVRAILEANGQLGWHPWAALFSAGFFCLHAGNSEVANYVSARSEQLCAMGVLGALLTYLKLPRGRAFQLHAIPMMLGALAKTPAVIFGPLLLVYKLVYEADLRPAAWDTAAGRQRIGRAVVTSLPSLVLGALTFKFVDLMNGPAQRYGGYGRLEYLRTETWVWLRYLRLFAVPTGLSADPDMPLLPTWKDPRVAAGICVLLLTLAIAAWAAVRTAYKPVAFGIVWFWLGIGPTSSVIPIGDITNDHRMYLGWLGLTLATTTVLFEQATRLLGLPASVRVLRPMLVTLAGAVLIAHASWTAHRNRIWSDNLLLWADAVDANPQSGRGWLDYGVALMHRGVFDEARRCFAKAASLTPTYANLAVARGDLEALTGNPEAAERFFRDALTFVPKSGLAPFTYASFLVNWSRAPEAIPLLQTAQELDWGDLQPRKLLLDLAAARGNQDSVQTIARGILNIGPDTDASAYLNGGLPFTPKEDTSKAWFDLGLAFNRAARHSRAAQAYRVAVQRDALNADAWNGLGQSLLALGFVHEAIPALQRAVALHPQDENFRKNLEGADQRLASLPRDHTQRGL